ncbi:MAG TPA: glutamine-hydrolyzing carbamoyl-phosphate synthase small subunit [Ktedonobacterales bacterium]|nr:glutamine-hydrolyzing carbamoyl-phosphate synthase small subunit [Ktedonobacterales bacterium]
METQALLVLEDGSSYAGQAFGALDPILSSERKGEVVFATGMTGYQEICTDPSYRGQMVVLTYPLIGNYGVNPEDVESRRPWLSALIVRECCEEYHHWRGRESLSAYLAREGIPGLQGIDTRALTRRLRASGTLRGVLRAYQPGQQPNLQELIAAARSVKTVSDLDVVEEVTLGDIRSWSAETAMSSQPLSLVSASPASQSSRQRVVLIDTGYKEQIARCLSACGLETILAPAHISTSELLALQPDGVLLANGPGDPETVASLIEVCRALLATGIPLMGICLGHQMLGLAIGARTSRLPFGHHGANHPVREVRTGRVTITSQNHNFQVDAATVPAESGFYVSHINLSDGSVEGLAHETLPVFSVQYHPEASPGPHDNRHLFERFASLISGRKLVGAA